MFKLDLEKTETRGQIGNIHWNMEKARILFKKKNYFCFLDYDKNPLCGSQQSAGNSWRHGNTRLPTCLLRDLYPGQETTSEIQIKKSRWFEIGEGKKKKKLLHLSPCWFNFYAEHILENAGLEETQDEIKRKREISITSDMQMMPSI